MKRIICIGLMTVTMPLGIVSCAKREPERKVVGPTSTTSKIPWNQPIAGQGGGQMGMMPQNMHRR